MWAANILPIYRKNLKDEKGQFNHYASKYLPCPVCKIVLIVKSVNFGIKQTISYLELLLLNAKY